MKNLLSITVLIAGMFLFTHSAYAQEEVNLGGGIVYGTEIEAVGIQINGNYGFTEEIRGAADISIYFPDQPSDGDYSFWTFNANVHYLFHEQEGASFYGIGGD